MQSGKKPCTTSASASLHCDRAARPVPIVRSRFLDNVYAGDKVVASGRITAIDGDRIDCEFSLEAEGRGTVNSGTATVRLDA